MTSGGGEDLLRRAVRPGDLSGKIEEVVDLLPSGLERRDDAPDLAGRGRLSDVRGAVELLVRLVRAPYGVLGESAQLGGPRLARGFDGEIFLEPRAGVLDPPEEIEEEDEDARVVRDPERSPPEGGEDPVVARADPGDPAPGPDRLPEDDGEDDGLGEGKRDGGGENRESPRERGDGSLSGDGAREVGAIREEAVGSPPGESESDPGQAPGQRPGGEPGHGIARYHSTHSGLRGAGAGHGSAISASISSISLGAEEMRSTPPSVMM